MSDTIHVRSYDRAKGTVRPKWILVNSDTMSVLDSIKHVGLWEHGLSDPRLYTRNQLKRYLKRQYGKEWETTHPHMIMLAVR